jgi:hypothetical protein
MRLITILVVAAVLVTLGWNRWQKSQDPLASATQSSYGFVEVPMPDGAHPGTVLIFTPLNCPSDLAQRANALFSELEREGIPVKLSSHYSASLATSEQKQAIKRFHALNEQPGPVVLIDGWAKANPTAHEVISEYKSRDS